MNPVPPLVLPEPLRADRDGDRVAIWAADGGPSATFVVRRLASLTVETADLVVDARAPSALTLVSYATSSAEARQRLRDARISFAGDDGRVFLHAPMLYVDREPEPRRQTKRAAPEPGGSDASRNPFADRASRVPRWLLLHPDRESTVTAVAAGVDLSPSVVSRVVRALDDAALLDSARAPDGRIRGFRLRRGEDVLQRWAASRTGKRQRQRLWDVGATDAPSAIGMLAEAHAELPGLRWAVGGLAGAATQSRAVEPGDVVVWVDRGSLDELEDLLMPEPGRSSGRGNLKVWIAPDPWILSLASAKGGVPVADPVQLWLDCAAEGERALEAAGAIAREMGW